MHVIFLGVTGDGLALLVVTTGVSWLNLTFNFGDENSKLVALKDSQPALSPTTVVAICC